MPAVLDGGTAYIVSGPGGQGTGIVGQDVFLCHGPQFVLLQLDAGGVLFLLVAGGSLIFLICHADPSYGNSGITETGRAELRKGYESILQPFYDLWRSSPEDFEAFMHYADRLAAHIEKGREKIRDHEVL